MEDFWQKLWDLGGGFAERLVGALLILLLGWIGLRLLIRPLQRLLQGSRVEPSVASYLGSLAHSAFIIVLILAALQQLGVQTASLVTLLGAAGLAIALSLQGLLANFTSGLLLLSYRMFRVGDLIEVGEHRGRVSEMLPFHIVLVTADNLRIIVPNTVLTSSAVRNHSALPQRRLLWTLELTPQDSLSAVKEVLRARLLATPGVLAEPAPQIYVQEWTAAKRVLAVHAWTGNEDAQTLQQTALEVLGQALEEQRASVQSTEGDGAAVAPHA